jgi:hypothetical protein
VSNLAKEEELVWCLLIFDLPISQKVFITRLAMFVVMEMSSNLRVTSTHMVHERITSTMPHNKVARSKLFSHTFHFYTFAIISRFSPRTPRIPTKAKAKVKLGQGRQPHYTCVSHGTLLPAHAQYSTHCISFRCVHMSTRSPSVESCIWSFRVCTLLWCLPLAFFG